MYKIHGWEGGGVQKSDITKLPNIEEIWLGFGSIFSCADPGSGSAWTLNEKTVKAHV